MDRLFADLVAFYEEHRCCGDLESGADSGGSCAWLACSCGGRFVRPSPDEAVDDA